MVAATQIRIDDRKSFQRLKSVLHRRIVDAVDLDKAAALDEGELRAQLRALAVHVCSAESAGLPCELREAMVGEILDEIYGLGPLEALWDDPGVSDVLVNGPDSVWVERDGRLEETDVRFADEAHLLLWIHRLAARAGRRIDANSPTVDARLPDGTRICAIIAPLAVRGPSLSLRRFKPSFLALDALVDRRTLAPEMAEFLIAAVESRFNILISGNTGAGKTTLLNDLAGFIPPSERIVTIEQSAELCLPQSDVVSLEMRPAGGRQGNTAAARDLVESSLRMRPDRIILGDAQGPEVLELVQAIITGHEGSMCSVQANDPRDALDRLEMMIGLSGVELPAAAVRQYIGSAFQIIVHLARLASGERKILRIAELGGCRDGAYRLDDIFVYRLAGVAETGCALGTFYSTGYEPASVERLRSLGAEIPRDLFAPRELSDTSASVDSK